MSYKTDYDPIEYLVRRAKYYKKQASSFKSRKLRDLLGHRYSEDEFNKAVARAEQMERKFNRAAEILSQET